MQSFGLQPALAHGQNLDAGQFAVFADRAAVGLRHRARSRDFRASLAGRSRRRQPGAPRARRKHLGGCRPAPSPTAPARTPFCKAACCATAKSTPIGFKSTTTCKRRLILTKRRCRDIAIRQLHRRLRRLSDGHGARRRFGFADRDVGRERRRFRQLGAAHAILAADCRAAGRVQIRSLADRRIFEALHRRRGLAARGFGRRAEYARQVVVFGFVRQRRSQPLSAVADRARLRQSGIGAFRLLSAKRAVRRIRAVRARAWPRFGRFRFLSRIARLALAGRERRRDALALSRGRRSLRRSGARFRFLRPPRSARPHFRRRLTSRRPNHPTPNTRFGL